jgi:hypothetical protein
MNQNTELSGLGCQGSNMRCAIAIQPNIPTSKATSDSVSAFTASKIASCGEMFLIYLIGKYWKAIPTAYAKTNSARYSAK